MDQENQQFNTPQQQDKDLGNKLLLVDQKSAQELLDERFPLDKRNERLSQASLDSKGRRVRYYRYMDWNKLTSLISQGEVTPSDHFENVYENPNSDDLYLLI